MVKPDSEDTIATNAEPENVADRASSSLSEPAKHRNASGATDTETSTGGATPLPRPKTGVNMDGYHQLMARFSGDVTALLNRNQLEEAAQPVAFRSNALHDIEGLDWSGAFMLTDRDVAQFQENSPAPETNRDERLELQINCANRLFYDQTHRVTAIRSPPSLSKALVECLHPSLQPAGRVIGSTFDLLSISYFDAERQLPRNNTDNRRVDFYQHAVKHDIYEKTAEHFYAIVASVSHHSDVTLQRLTAPLKPTAGAAEETGHITAPEGADSIPGTSTEAGSGQVAES